MRYYATSTTNRFAAVVMAVLRHLRRPSQTLRYHGTLGTENARLGPLPPGQLNPSSLSARITEGIALMRSRQFRRFSGSSTPLLGTTIRTQKR